MAATWLLRGYFLQCGQAHLSQTARLRAHRRLSEALPKNGWQLKPPYIQIIGNDRTPFTPSLLRGTCCLFFVVVRLLWALVFLGCCFRFTSSAN